MPDETRAIEPALTAEEWARQHSDPVLIRPGQSFTIMAVSYGYATDRFRAMALANAALPDDDPRKITRPRPARIDRRAPWRARKLVARRSRRAAPKDRSTLAAAGLMLLNWTSDHVWKTIAIVAGVAYLVWMFWSYRRMKRTYRDIAEIQRQFSLGLADHVVRQATSPEERARLQQTRDEMAARSRRDIDARFG